MTCFFAAFFDDPCEGRVDRCHIGLQKQTLRHRGLTEDEVWDPRIVRFGCRHHHERSHGPSFRLSREQIPESVEEFAADHGLSHRLDRDYGEREVAV